MNAQPAVTGSPTTSASQKRAVPARGAWVVSPALGWVLALALLAAGFGIRLLNLNNPPLDFHPTRQLRAAIIARGMYYDKLPGVDPQLRAEAITMWASMEAYEPPVLERLVAATYPLVGGEHLWVARVYSSLFWIIGGAALFALARRIFSTPAALFALGFYLFLPWGVQASRSFQPDPWMVMWVLLAALALYRWSESKASSWLWGLLAGLFCGIAVLIKAMAVFPVAGMILFVLLGLVFDEGNLLRNLWALVRRPQVWVFALITGLIPAFYYLGLGQRSSDFASFWIFSLSGLLKDRKFYIHWLGLVHGLMDVMVFFAALLGAFLFPKHGRAIVLGLWLGYLLTGLTFPFQIYTHDYYSLMLVPTVALSLAVFAQLVVDKLRQQPLLWRAVFVLFFLGVAGYYAYVARSNLYAQDYSKEPIPWQIMGKALPRDGHIIGLTHDYGDRLKYYGWRMVNKMWPSQGDLDLAAAADKPPVSDFPGYFKDQTAGMDYFLVTLFADFNAQPDLKAMLYDHYPIAQQGDGYILFDLRHSK